MFDKAKVKSWIPKKLLKFVEQVDEDSEVVEVVLKEGFCHSTQAETVWGFSKESYECSEYTLHQIKDDLRDWLDHLAPQA